MVVSVTDLALVGQGHQAQATLVVAILACTTIRIGMTDQLAIGVVALASRNTVFIADVLIK
ncbi:hypothetical protein A9976_12765 [Delftia sp. UME58]|nr:hypothetical protein [Delftia sp. UME58]